MLLESVEVPPEEVVPSEPELEGVESGVDVVPSVSTVTGSVISVSFVSFSLF
ncbi:hypothetical protein D3C76_1570950 [compost metagenome]